MDSLFSIFGWLVGGSAIVWLLLALFAPSVLQVVSAWLVALSPLIKGLAEFTVAVVKRLWDGLLDVVDNINTVLLVVAVGVLGLWYGGYIKDRVGPVSEKNVAAQRAQCSGVIETLRKDYRFVPRTKAEKRAYLKRTGGGRGFLDTFGLGASRQ